MRRAHVLDCTEPDVMNTISEGCVPVTIAKRANAPCLTSPFDHLSVFSTIVTVFEACNVAEMVVKLSIISGSKAREIEFLRDLSKFNKRLKIY